MFKQVTGLFMDCFCFFSGNLHVVPSNPNQRWSNELHQWCRPSRVSLWNFTSRYFESCWKWVVITDFQSMLPQVPYEPILVANNIFLAIFFDFAPVGVCRTPMWCTRRLFRNWQIAHSESHWIAINVDVMLWCCDVTWRWVFANMKKDITEILFLQRPVISD